LRTVFLGTSEFAGAVLRRLAESEHRPALVVTRPDRPRGRGRKLASPPVAELARELGIELDQPASVNEPDARARIAAARPDVVCVCAFGALIKEPLLYEHPMLNVHPALLPRGGGAAPLERAIMAGDELTGVSIMEVSAGLDSGPVCALDSEAILPSDTYGTLGERLAKLGGELLVNVLSESPPCTPQDESGATYAEKIGPEDRRLDPARPAVELERVLRALTPHVGVHVELPDGTWLGVLEARALPDTGPAPGTLVFEEGRPVLGCAEGSLELLTVQPPGRRAMNAEDYVRGLHGRGG
jgi:methionyl-tRNA formyltransferase